MFSQRVTKLVRDVKSETQKVMKQCVRRLTCPVVVPRVAGDGLQQKLMKGHVVWVWFSTGTLKSHTHNVSVAKKRHTHTHTHGPAELNFASTTVQRYKQH